MVTIVQIVMLRLMFLKTAENALKMRYNIKVS